MINVDMMSNNNKNNLDIIIDDRLKLYIVSLNTRCNRCKNRKCKKNLKSIYCADRMFVDSLHEIDDDG